MGIKSFKRIYLFLLILFTVSIYYSSIVLDSNLTFPLIFISLILHSLAGKVSVKREAMVTAFITFILLGYISIFKY